MSTNDEINAVIEIFRGEAHELLQSIGDAMLKLEKASTDEQRNSIIGEAFRHAHSVKGAAGSLDFGRVEQLVHALEDLLAAIHKGRIAPSPEILDLIFTGLDTITAMVATSHPGDEQLQENEQLLLKRLLAEVPREDAPASGEDAPASGEEAQASGEEAQASGEDAPASGEDAPASGKEAPGEDAPASSKNAPGEDAPASGGFVRISQHKLNTLLTQVTELVEMKVRMEEMFRGVRAAEDELRKLQIPDADRPGQSLRQLARGMDQDLQFLQRLLGEIQDELKELRMVPIGTIFPVLRRSVRDVCRKRNLEINLTLGGGEYELDRKIVEELKTPLVHLLRNAAGHGVEKAEERAAAGKPKEGRVELYVSHQGNSIRLEVRDDGRGVDLDQIHRRAVDLGLFPRSSEDPSPAELMHLLFSAGMSTSHIADTVSGRGVGLSAVKQIVEKLHGTISVDSEQWRGTSFVITVPLTLATDIGLFLLSGDTRFAIPRTAVQRVLAFSSEDVSVINDVANLWYGDQHIPIARLDSSLHLSTFVPDSDGSRYLAVILSSAEATGAVVVDEVEGEAEIVVRSLGSFVQRLQNISGLTIAASGDIHFVLNPSDLIRTMFRPLVDSARPARLAVESGDASEWTETVILVVDDSVSSRTLNQKLLASSGFKVVTAADGLQALDLLRSRHFDLVLTDVQMPNMDGYQLTVQIKTDPLLSHIPVILLTALDRRKDKERGLDVGADAYLVKREVSQALLVSTIAQLI